MRAEGLAAGFCNVLEWGMIPYLGRLPSRIALGHVRILLGPAEPQGVALRSSHATALFHVGSAMATLVWFLAPIVGNAKQQAMVFSGTDPATGSDLRYSNPCPRFRRLSEEMISPGATSGTEAPGYEISPGIHPQNTTDYGIIGTWSASTRSTLFRRRARFALPARMSSHPCPGRWIGDRPPSSTKY